MTKLRPKLLVIMPFGSRKDDTMNGFEVVDFDRVYEELIAFVATEIGHAVLRMDQITTPGRISEQLLRELFEADIVIADITLPNANVFYELGIRQAITAGPSILIAQNGIQLPFDFRDQRVLLYEMKAPEQLSESRIKLCRALMSLEDEHGDNPVQSFLREIGVSPSPSTDIAGFEHEISGRVERARNVNQLVAVWSWVQQFKPLPTQSLIQLAERLADEKEWPVATAVIKVALDARPNDFELLRQYAWYLRHQGAKFYDEAEQSFRKALSFNPGDPETLGMLGGLYKRQERFPEAAQYYKRGAQISPNNRYMKVNQAAMELLTNPEEPALAITHYGELVAEIEKSISQTYDEWTEFILGEAHFVSGDIEKAKHHFVKAAQILSSPIALQSPADQIELFGKKGFKREEAKAFATWIKSLPTQFTANIKMSDGLSPKIPDTSRKSPILLHLSDIHFGTTSGPDGAPVSAHRFKDTDDSITLQEHLIDEFISKRKHFNIGDSPLYLIVTGDITNTGTIDEFKEAHIFLNNICEQLDIPRERVIICPGNHDVDWKSAKIDVEKRLDNYIAFIANFYGKALFSKIYPIIGNLEFGTSPKPTDIISYQPFLEDGLLFVSLNSCVYETNEHHYGYISLRQLRNYNKILENESASNTSVRIAVMHHHMHPFPEAVSLLATGDHWTDQSTIRDSALVERHLEKYRFDLVLHGHKHKAQIRETVIRDCSLEDDTAPLIVCGAGSCGVQSKELGHSVPNHYQVIEILQTPRRKGVDFVRIEWREITLDPGAEWITPKRWILKG